jgi:endonuclease YncB( thermonuclease family)
VLDLEIDLGFNVQRKVRARLANVDAKELDQKRGRDARDFVADTLMSAKTVVVKTTRIDLYGRYVVHVFLARRQLTLADCFDKGIYLNDLLVREKHAVVVAS